MACSVTCIGYGMSSDTYTSTKLSTCSDILLLDSLSSNLICIDSSTILVQNYTLYMPLTFQSSLKRYTFEPWHQFFSNILCFLEYSMYEQTTESNQDLVSFL